METEHYEHGTGERRRKGREVDSLQTNTERDRYEYSPCSAPDKNTEGNHGVGSNPPQGSEREKPPTISGVSRDRPFPPTGLRLRSQNQTLLRNRVQRLRCSQICSAERFITK